MKKIVSLLLVLVLAVGVLASCGGSEAKEYKLAIAVDNAVSGTKVTNTLCALIIDADGKIVACRFDSLDAQFTLDADGALKVPENLTSKVELGDAYVGMPAGSWAKQAKAYEDYVVGKTAAEVAAMDNALVTGCTMQSTAPTFKALIAKAFNYAYKVSFTAETAPTLGASFSVSASGSLDEDDNKAKVTADAGAVAMVDGKVAAAVLDTAERSGTLAVEDEALVLTAPTFSGTKAEQGDSYEMPAGAWYKQAQGFCSRVVGLDGTTIADLAVTGDAMTAAGCTMQGTVYGYKTVLTKAINAAR